MIRVIGAHTIEIYERLSLFFLEVSTGFNIVVRKLLAFKFRTREAIHQMYVIGVQSVPVMVFTLCFVSLMFTLEFAFHMNLVLRQYSLVPAFSTVFMLRELGPVVTCFLLASRVGAAIAAEIGTMKVTEQLEALKLMAVDPVEYLLIPRWIGCVFACVSISFVAVAISILAGAFVFSVQMNFPTGQYFATMFAFAKTTDFMQCGVKAVVFGTIIPFVAAYCGFNAEFGAVGVGNATTRAVVYSFLLIFIADFVLTYLMYGL